MCRTICADYSGSSQVNPYEQLNPMYRRSSNNRFTYCSNGFHILSLVGRKRIASSELDLNIILLDEVHGTNEGYIGPTRYR